MSQAVHDLRWVINSPSFVSGENVASTEPLAIDDVDPDCLARFLAEYGEVHRVGRYFEQLVHYWLLHIRKVEVLGAGVQIRDGKRTIGELDFVYRHEDGDIVHSEVAVKFFLHHPREGISDFPGPNASDNFELKTTKLFNQQLELSRLHYPSVQRREALVKGIMFYRGERPSVLPPRMNAEHDVGRWIRANELDQLRDDASVHAAVIVQKPHWLAPVADAPIRDLDDIVQDLGQHFADGSGHPIMVSLRDPSSGVERQRMFIVSTMWPA